MRAVGNERFPAARMQCKMRLPTRDRRNCFFFGSFFFFQYLRGGSDIGTCLLGIGHFEDGRSYDLDEALGR
jgi:hypothetical protein